MALFTSESVSQGHPDKLADQISDALLDHFIAFDPTARVACETLVTSGQVVLAGEVHTSTYVDVREVVRNTIKKVGYDDGCDHHFSASSCGILSAIHEQSQDIAAGVFGTQEVPIGAGDQGTMFGYATRETAAYMPMPIFVAHRIMERLGALRKEEVVDYLRPDAKCQVTVAYDAEMRPQAIDNIVLSTQHRPVRGGVSVLRKKIKEDVLALIMPEILEALPRTVRDASKNIRFFINPAGAFETGGPHSDTGLTGRKIVVDTYGGFVGHGGGSFSGKDPSKVDRSAAYALRHIAKNMVAAGLAERVQLSISYAIGKEEPVGYQLNTLGTSHLKISDEKLAALIVEMFDMRPAAVIERLHLRRPIYSETAVYGHMGRVPVTVEKTFCANGHQKSAPERLFTWEQLDCVEALRDLRTMHS